PIAYQRILPNSVARLTPEKAKRYFWGTFRLQANTPIYGVHLLKTNPAWVKKVADQDQTQQFILDIFVRTNDQFKRIQRIPFRYNLSLYPPDLVKAELLWIDKKKTIPLLKLKIFTVFDDAGGTGYNGPDGTEVTFAFPYGISKDAQVQTWGEFINQKNDWTTRGTGGLLRVVTYKRLAAQPKKKTKRTIWTWGQKQFRAVKTDLIYEDPI
ncbi:MAG: hypothetical protein ABI210_05760, partial [Abditibacteriaceae bacterium]